MRTKLILFIVVCAVSSMLIPVGRTLALPPCQERDGCNTDCQPDPNPDYDGWSKCSQEYSQAKRCPSGEGIQYSGKYCGKVWFGKYCIAGNGDPCGSLAYTTGNCDP
jgi:hypothetical protein